jgi:hypothetical protein
VLRPCCALCATRATGAFTRQEEVPRQRWSPDSMPWRARHLRVNIDFFWTAALTKFSG